MSFFSNADLIEIEPKPWMTKKEFVLVTNLEQLSSVIDQAINAGKCALDLETTGLDSRIKDNRTVDDIVGYCLSYDGETGFYIPVGHVDQSTGKSRSSNLSRLPVAEEIKRLCENCVTIYHNALFDHEFLYGSAAHIQIEDPDMFEDTLILDYLRKSTAFKHGLKHLSKEFLGMEMISLKDLFADRSGDLSYARLDPENEPVLWYAASDAICTYLLYEFLKEHGEDQKHVYRIEKACVPAHRWMERNRPRIDLQYTTRLIDEMSILEKQSVDDIYESLYESLLKYEDSDLWDDLGSKSGLPVSRVKKEFSPNFIRGLYDVYSTKQLGDMLELLKKHNDEFSTVELERTEASNQVKTSNDALDRLEEDYGDQFTFIKNIGRMRSLQKALSTYAKPLHENVDREDSTTRLKFVPYKTDSGRFAAKGGRPEFGYSGVQTQSMPATYNGASFPVRQVHGRPEGPGDNNPELFDGFQEALEEDFLKLVYDNHFIQDLEDGQEYCVRKTCEGCPFASECDRTEPFEKKFLSLEAAMRPAFVGHRNSSIVACVKEGTTVPEKGETQKRIEDIEKGDEVLTEKGWKTVTSKVYNGEKETIKLKTYKGYQVEVTKDHLVRTIDEEKGMHWKEAGLLKEGDWMVQVSNFIDDKDRSKELPQSSYENVFTEEIKFPKKLDEGLSELLGRFIGDGCIGGSKRQEYAPFLQQMLKKKYCEKDSSYVALSLGEDHEELAKRINQKFQRYFGVQLKHRKKGDYHKFSMPLAYWFDQITNKNDKDKEYEVPDCVMKSSRTNVCAFLRGLFDADGFAGKDGGVQLYSISETLIDQVQFLLLGLGITARKSFIQRHTNFGYSEGYQLCIYGIRNTEIFREEVNFVTKRKKKRLLKRTSQKNRDIFDFIPYDYCKDAVIRQRNPETNRFHSNGRRRKRVTLQMLEKAAPFEEDVDETRLKEVIESDLRFDTISEITNTGKNRVYDLTVPEARHFQANNLIVHNCDYSGVELRVTTNLTNEANWIEEFEEGDGDLHTLTAKIVYGKKKVESLPPGSSERKKMRQNAKAANFAVLYGGGGGAIARQTGVTYEEGNDILNRMLNGLPAFSKWKDQTIKKAHRKEYVETCIGRKIKLDRINDAEYRIKSAQERKAVNSVIQGSAGGDVLKYSMGAVYREMKNRGWLDRVRMFATIHDELVFDIDNEVLEEAIPVIKDRMVEFSDKVGWRIPLEVDVELDRRWQPKYDWGKIFTINEDTGLAKQNFPKYLKPYITLKRGMWCKDNGEKWVYNGDDLVPVEKFDLSTEQNMDDTKEKQEQEQDGDIIENLENEQERKKAQKPDLPTYEYKIRTNLTEANASMYMLRLKRVLEAMKALIRDRRTEATHCLKIKTMQNEPVFPDDKTPRINPTVFEVLAYYEGL